MFSSGPRCAGPGAGTGSPCAHRWDLAVSVFAGVKFAPGTCRTEPSGRCEAPGADSAGVVQTVMLTLRSQGLQWSPSEPTQTLPSSSLVDINIAMMLRAEFVSHLRSENSQIRVSPSGGAERVWQELQGVGGTPEHPRILLTRGLERTHEHPIKAHMGAQ